jgi:hypothetical protein
MLRRVAKQGESMSAKVTTKRNKKLTEGSKNFILKNAGKMSGPAIAKVLHRPLKTVQSFASVAGVSLKLR